jgi:hypothetical protein
LTLFLANPIISTEIFFMTLILEQEIIKIVCPAKTRLSRQAPGKPEENKTSGKLYKLHRKYNKGAGSRQADNKRLVGCRSILQTPEHIPAAKDERKKGVNHKENAKG